MAHFIFDKILHRPSGREGDMVGFEFTDWQISGLIISVLMDVVLGYYILNYTLRYLYPLERDQTDDDDDEENAYNEAMRRILNVEIRTGSVYLLVCAPVFTCFITTCLLFPPETPFKMSLFTIFLPFFGTMLGFFIRKQKLQFHWLVKCGQRNLNLDG